MADDYQDGSEEKSVPSLGKVVELVMPDIVRKAFLTGAGMLFLTEEGIRKAVSDLNLPRDAVQFLVKQSRESKDELFEIVQKELNRFLSAIDVTKHAKEILDGMSLEVKTSITIRADEDRVKPELKAGIRPKKAKSKPKSKK